MRKLLYIIIFFGLLFLVKPAHAGIIIRPVFNSGLVGYWDFQTGAGNTVHDKSGQINDGTWAGTGSHWIDGKIGEGGNFDGTSDYVTLPSVIYISTGSPFSLSMWFYVNSTHPASPALIVLKDTTVSNGGWVLGLYDVGGHTLIFGNNNSGTWAVGQSASGMSLITWHHLVLTYNGSGATTLSNFSLYIDGAPMSVSAFGGGWQPASNANWIGYDNGGSSDYWAGKEDEVRVYNRALSASEVTRLYNLSQPKFGINELGIVPDDLPSNASISYVRENCTGYSPCYHSLKDWEAAVGGFDFTDHSCASGDLTCLDITAVAKIDGTWNAPDPDGATTIDGWTTDATRYIKIYTTATARHNGKWNDTDRYRLQTTATSIINREAYVRIDGLQVKLTTSTSSAIGIRDYITATGGETRVSNCIVWGVISGSTYQTGISPYGSTVTHTAKYFNNIIYGFNTSYGAGIAWIETGTTVYAYNNTVYGCNIGYTIYEGAAAGSMVLKNNIAYNNVDNYDNAVTGGSNNLSGPNSDASMPATGARNGVVVNFVDATNKDFHLAPADTGARDYGADLTNDANMAFSTDIDRQARNNKWDIGADEFKGVGINTSQKNQITNGLVGYWSFNGPDINGTDAVDRSGSGNDGTISGTTKTIGKVGQALSFNGTSDYVGISQTPSFVLSGKAYSISLWWKDSDYAGSGQRIVSWYDGVGNIQFGFSTGQFYIIDSAISATPKKNTDTVTSGWNHVVAVSDGAGNYKIYLNGVSVSGSWAQGSLSVFTSNTTTIYLGQMGSGGYAKGLLDELRIYNRALSVDEIKRLYNLGR